MISARLDRDLVTKVKMTSTETNSELIRKKIIIIQHLFRQKHFPKKHFFRQTVKQPQGGQDEGEEPALTVDGSYRGCYLDRWPSSTQR